MNVKSFAFGSLFTGIGGFDLALQASGMECLWQVERDKSCRSVLKREWNGVTLYDDVVRFRSFLEPRNAGRTSTAKPIRPNLICGGFPCQDLSVAGRRAGLAGNRSGLWFEFRRIIALLRPDWVLIENVDGLRSSNGGRDLGTILRSLGNMGYGWAYRVLDSQWFGLAQRRERVFIVGCLGSRTSAAKILFESDCLPWHPSPSRATGQRVAASLTRGTASGRGVNEPGRRREDDVNLAYCLNAKGGSGRIDGESETFVPVSSALSASGRGTERAGESRGQDVLIAHSLRAEGFDASEDGAGRGTPIIPIDMRQSSRGATMTNNRREGTTGGAPGTGIGEPGDPAFTVCGSHPQAIAFDERNVTSKTNRSRVEPGLPCHTLHADAPRVASIFGVRRLTPRECERLQGFPDDWTRWADDGSEISDSARYRMLGNAVSVPVVKWIGNRIATLQQIPK